MNAARVTAVVVLSVTAAGAVPARDLGVLGPTYEITEPHLLADIERRLREKERSGELQRHVEQARKRGVAAVNSPEPVAGVSATAKPRTFYFDPTVTLDRNLVDDKGRLIHAAGTRRNPLDVVSMSKHLLFFDARDARQVRRARELAARYDGKVKPILIGGSYLELMKAWRTPVFYDQQGVLVRRLGIRQVPALVSQEGKRLRIDELEVK